MMASARSQSTAEASHSRGYRTAPDHETTAWPPGIPYIVGNEACERFSFYGMRAILYAHLVSLHVAAGAVIEEASSQATEATHLFFAGVYALPMIGAILADRLVGKYQTIFWLSLVYCAGHAVLAVGESSLTGMYLGLALIAIGSGGIKPCVSANVGDQFGRNNWFRVRTVYQIFYFSINFGSFFSTLLIPQVQKYSGNWVLQMFPALQTRYEADNLGTSIAFGIPGILMFIATFIFWLGRKKYVHVPPAPGGRLGLLDSLSSIALFMAVGHLFYTKDSSALVIGASSVGFLVLGLALFAWRQNMEQDDGFLAITLYAVASKLGLASPAGEGGGPRQPRAPEGGLEREPIPPPMGEHLEAGIPGVPAVSAGPEGDGPTAPRDPFGPLDTHDQPLARSWLWGPAVQKFGHEAVEGPVAVFKIVSVFFLISVFWALFDQHSSTWIRQAKAMDRTITFGNWGSFTLTETQIPALNPLMVMILIPLMNMIYVRLDRLGIQTTPLRRITVGMLVASASFASVALIQTAIDRQGEGAVHVAWQVLPYLIITVAEVMVSITGLEFAYTQAPRRMKSTVMGFWLLSVSLGNVLVAFLATFKDLPLANFFWVFAGLMAGAGLIFGLRAWFYVPRDYAQE